MIAFKIKSVQYDIKDVTISDYYKIQHLLLQDEVKNKLEIVSYLSGCDTKTLKLLDKRQFAELWNTIISGPLNISEKSPFHKSFILNDKEYGFMDLDKITVGEYADMDILRSDPQANQMIHMMMAVLYRPATRITNSLILVEPYNSDTLKERAELFKELPLKYVYGALNFFLQVPRTLLNNTLNSLIRKKGMKLEEKQMIETVNQLTLELLEDGTTLSSSRLETILQKLKRLQTMALSMSSTISHTEKIKPEKKENFMIKYFKKIKSKIK